jgi:hypothetical protein
MYIHICKLTILGKVSLSRMEAKVCSCQLVLSVFTVLVAVGATYERGGPSTVTGHGKEVCQTTGLQTK